MSKKFTLMKVFDSYKMPGKLRTKFFDLNSGTGNSCYVSWYVSFIETEDEEDYDKDVLVRYREIDAWLIENGANPNEHVLVSHSW